MSVYTHSLEGASSLALVQDEPWRQPRCKHVTLVYLVSGSARVQEEESAVEAAATPLLP